MLPSNQVIKDQAVDDLSFETVSEAVNAADLENTLNKFICGFCPEPATHSEPTRLCTEHYMDWELHIAEFDADMASERLTRVQKAHAISRKQTRRNEFKEWLGR